MTTRDTFIAASRGDSFGTVSAETSEEEFFQNETLRPIAKLQNDLLLAVFQTYMKKSKIDFRQYSIEKRMSFVESTIKKDMKFQNLIKGIFVGTFTLEEYNRYTDNTSGINKRIMNLTIERIKSQIQLLSVL